MPTEFPVSFGNQSNPGRDGQDGTARLLNAYAEFAGKEGKTEFPIYAIEGLARITNWDTSTGVRAMETLDGSIYAVAGQQVFKAKADGSSTTLLGGMPGTGTVYTARNQNAAGAQIALVNEGTVQVIQNDTLTALNDPDLPPPNSVTTLGGYFIFTISDGRVYITGINNTEVNALDFGIANQFPDGLLRGIAANGFLWLFGPDSTEIWDNTGNADFPFQLVSGGAIERGTISGASPALIAKTVFWVDQDGVVLAAQGSSPTRVSTHAVERSIANCPNPNEITGMAYTFRGHQFYVISGETFTWAFDLTNGLWHERESYGLTRWRGERYAKLGEGHYVGDYEQGRIYRIDADSGDEDGNPIIWECTTPIIHSGQKRLSHSRLDLDMLTGVGKNSTVPTEFDPIVALRYSDDGGHNFGKWRRTEMGKIGEYYKHVKFHRLGQASRQGRAYTVRSSADVTRGLMGATLRIKNG